MRIAQVHILLTGLCALALVAGAGPRAEAADQAAANTQTAYQPPIAPASRLQIGGTADSLSVDVERADVQSTLRAVLKQAGKQFAPDATVTGRVTLLLTDQPFDTVLRAVCDAAYLKYTAEPSGLYKFTRDDDAVRRAFSQLRQLNEQLRGQLRALGLDVPSDNQLSESRLHYGAAGGAGFGGASAPAPVERDIARLEAQAGNTGPAGPAGAAGPGGPRTRDAGAPANADSAKPLGAARALKKDSAAAKSSDIHAYLIPQSNLNQLAGGGRSAVSEPQEYGRFMLQNGFVWFNIPEEKPEPVASVLQMFSQQANVPILVDQSIPNSLKFRVWGSLSPRQLPEALNLLAPTAHLQWRWIGSTVFVVPAPTFNVYFGDQAAFRSGYPPAARQDNGADGKRGGQE
jgi:hypothetical protein